VKLNTLGLPNYQTQDWLWDDVQGMNLPETPFAIRNQDNGIIINNMMANLPDDSTDDDESSGS